MAGERKFALLFALGGAGLLCGCGLHVPEIEEAWDDRGGDDRLTLEMKIKQKVFCEVKEAVKSVGPVNNAGVWSSGIPDDWGVQLTMNLQVDETGALSPGVTLNTPMIPGTTFFPNKITVPGPQSYAFGL